MKENREICSLLIFHLLFKWYFSGTFSSPRGKEIFEMVLLKWYHFVPRLYAQPCTRNKVIMNNLSSFYHLHNQKQSTLNDLPYIFLTSFCLRSARLRDQRDACCRSEILHEHKSVYGLCFFFL
jgi:hypothetical protein